MLKKLMKKEEGFTLAELLIVVAIIAVLTAIAIPVFTSQMEKSREATDLANLRSAYGELVSSYLTDGKEHTAAVPCKQTQDKWNYQKGEIGSDITMTGGSGSAGSTRIIIPDEKIIVDSFKKVTM